MPTVRRLAFFAALAMPSWSALAAPPAPGFWLMGPPVGSSTVVTSLTKDGGTAAGGAPSFTWTQVGGRFDFGALPGMPLVNYATGLSENGVVAGTTGLGVTSRAYRWTGTGPLQDLGVLPGETRSYSWGVSGDGSVVVGHAEHGDWTYFTGQAFRWTAAKGMQGLGYAKPWDGLSVAKGVSRDGTTVVGFSGPIGTDAFVWTEASGMEILPKLPGQVGYDTYAEAVNHNGSVVVGDSASVSGNSHAVRWLNGQVEDLASTFGTVNSTALAVSDDGSVIAGVYSTSTSFGFVWTSETGILNADGYLFSHGIKLPPDMIVEYIHAVSGDGLTFGGTLRNFITKQSQGFVATVAGRGSCKADCDASCTLNIDDFICFQTFFALGDTKADCDASGTLNIDDFICFQTGFALGC